MRTAWTLALLALVGGSFMTANAQSTALDPQSVLANVDSVQNAPRDQIQIMELTLIDNKGMEKGRSLKMWQKGSDFRVAKFLEPADVKNIGFLSLPDDVMYLYMPAFSKVRRIAAHVKNQKFAGTDFTYDDMGTIEYSNDYTASLLDESPDSLVLKLVPKPDSNKDYLFLKMWVARSNSFFTRIEYYDLSGNLWKVLDRREVSLIDGYWTSSEIEMHDIKLQHRTVMTLSEVEFDTGLEDSIFTQRFLRRRP